MSDAACARPRVAVVILNTNRRDDTLACLESLTRANYADSFTIVLDNASTDGSAAAIGAAYPDVVVVPLTENRGYAGNNNVGIALALERGADWVLVLNEDTVLAPSCLDAMVAAGVDASVGIVGPLVYHHDEPTVLQSAGGRLGPWWESIHIGANESDAGQYAGVRDVEWVTGCAIMVRRDVIDRLGAIDERFFYYWEETEWCVRARRAGWRIVVASDARLWHKGVRRDYHPSPSVSYYNTRNRFMLLSKHRAAVVVRMRAWFDTTRTLASLSLKPGASGKRAHRDAMWRGAVDYLRGRCGRMPA